MNFLPHLWVAKTESFPRASILTPTGFANLVQNSNIMELGRIQPEQRMACPDCRKLLPEWGLEDFEKTPRCPHCGVKVKLPEEVMNKLRNARHLGRNLDLMG